MARQQLGTAPTLPLDTATVGYVTTAIAGVSGGGSDIEITGAGIDPTGTTESTAGIQTFLTAGGEMVLRKGTYIVDGLSMTSNSKLKLSQGAILKQKVNSPANSEAIYIGPTVTDVEIHGGEIDGNVANQANAGVGGIFSRGSRIKIHHMKIYNTKYNAVSIDGGSIDVEVYRMHVIDSGFFGIVAGFYANETDQSKYLNFHHNRIDGTSNGASALGSTVNKADLVTPSPGIVDSIFAYNIITRSDHDGVACYSPNNLRVTVKANIVDHAGFTPSGSGAGGHLCHVGGTDLLVDSNIGRNHDGAAIVVSNFPNSAPVAGSGAVISNNIVNGTVLTTNGEGVVTQNFSNVVISNNQLKNCAQYGVHVIGMFGGVGGPVEDITVTGNDCLSNGLAGVKIDEATRANVSANNCINNGLGTADAGIRLEGVINSTVCDNVLAGNTLDGLRGVDGTSSACLDITIDGNVLANNGGWGTQFTGSANRINLGTNVYRSNSSGEHSIVGAASKGTVVSSRTAFAASGSMTRVDYLAAVTSTAAARVITLPGATTVIPGRPYIVKDESGGAAVNNITVATVSSQTIDGVLTKVIKSNYGWMEIYSDGTNWHVIRTTESHSTFTVDFGQPGTLTVAAGVARWYTPFACTIKTVVAAVATQPTGASILVDVNKNGTTIFTTQSNRPTITASTNRDESGVPEVIALAAGDYLSVDIDQVGSTIAGADLTVAVVLQIN